MTDCKKQMSNGCLKSSSQRLFKLRKEIDPKYSDYPKYSDDPKCNYDSLMSSRYYDFLCVGTSIYQKMQGYSLSLGKQFMLILISILIASAVFLNCTDV